MMQPLAAVFDLTPAGVESRLVFASPHSGRRLPPDMQPAGDLDEVSLNSACDHAVDQLLAGASGRGIPLLTGLVSRAYVDLNRAPDELDPLLLEDEAGLPMPGPKTRAGYGVVPRLTGNGRPLYDRRLTLVEAASRLDRVHRPYHEALERLMQSTKARHGQALLVDWHSMPERATGPGGPDIVLGDRYGTACKVETMRHMVSLFESIGWRVSMNRPYAGGYAIAQWGQPDAGYEAVQVELNRRLYWDEAEVGPSVGWRRCQTAVNRIIRILAETHCR